MILINTVDITFIYKRITNIFLDISRYILSNKRRARMKKKIQKDGIIFLIV